MDFCILRNLGEETGVEYTMKQQSKPSYTDYKTGDSYHHCHMVVRIFLANWPSIVLIRRIRLSSINLIPTFCPSYLYLEKSDIPQFFLTYFIFLKAVKMLDQHKCSVQFRSVQSFSHVQLFATQWTAACQASLSITNSWSLLKLMSIESVIPFNHLILCRPLLFPPSIFPSIRFFSKESILHIKWPRFWSLSFSISPSN